MDALMRDLDRLTFRQGEQILSKAGRRGGRLLAEEEEHLVPRDTGKLAANIKVNVTEKSATEVIINIGPSRKAFYASFRNWGTKYKRGEHFVERAWTNKNQEAYAVIKYDLGKFIDKALRNG